MTPKQIEKQARYKLMADMYISTGGTISAVARHFKTDKWCVKYALEKMGVPVRTTWKTKHTNVLLFICDFQLSDYYS